MGPIQRSKRTALLTIPLAFIAPRVVQAATYYVAPAPTGSDMNAGTMALPFASMRRAQIAVVPGDTVYFRAGTYPYTSAETSCPASTSTINGVLLNKSGTSGNMINYWAFPRESPVFDFSGIKEGCRITGLNVTGSWLYLKGLTVTGVPQNVNTNHESWGVYVNGGSNNIFEALNLHHNMGPGLFIIHGGNNQVINCDSHENYDPLSSSGAGGNADGFGCHVPAGDTGNEFRGCRAWWNSDDGWYFIEAAEVVTVDNSWSWHNGYLPGTLTASGNGNGFKAGGYGLIAANVPANPPVHVVQRCVALLNRAAGFYVNHHPVADHFYNNTSYGNHPDFDLLGVAADGVTAMNIAQLRNNLAFSGTLLSNNAGPMVDDAFNSWDTTLGVTVSAADFQNVSVTGMDGPRQADGSLPTIANFHLAAGSDLIDKGTNLGFPFVGAAPDLGAFEFGATSRGGGGGVGTGTGGAAGISGTGGRTGTGGLGGTVITSRGGTSAPGAGGSNRPSDPGGVGATTGAARTGSPAGGVSSNGCACSTPRSPGGVRALFASVIVAGWLRTRRRNRRHNVGPGR